MAGDDQQIAWLQPRSLGVEVVVAGGNTGDVGRVLVVVQFLDALDDLGEQRIDVLEAGLPDANLNGIVDGVIAANGWSTSVSGLAALNLPNTDGAGEPNYLDIDSDDDGLNSEP